MVDVFKRKPNFFDRLIESATGYIPAQHSHHWCCPYLFIWSTARTFI